MDLGTLIASASGVGACVGAFAGMRSTKLQTAASLNQLLDSRIGNLEESIRKKDEMIEELQEKVLTLGELVTSRADVETLKRQVSEIKDLVERVAAKLEA